MPSEVDSELMEKHPERIRSMFSDIASRYDLTNTLLTATTDTLWRNRTAFELTKELHRRVDDGRLSSPLTLLDACAGTGKLGNRILRHLKRNGIGYGVDFCLPLLKEGDYSNHNEGGIVPFAGDLLRMPVTDRSFDAVSIAFGYRNLTDRRAGLREIRRLLNDHGVLAILEFHVPQRDPVRTLYLLYFNHVLPVLGAWISGTTTGAYRYLNQSVLSFPPPARLKEEFRAESFNVLSHHPMMMGAVHLYLLANDPA